MVAMFVNGSGQNEHSLERTFHRCFLPSFTSFGWGVSEEKIKMWKVNGRRMPSDGKSSHCLWQGELKIGHWFLISLKQYKLQQICWNTSDRNFSKEFNRIKLHIYISICMGKPYLASLGLFFLWWFFDQKKKLFREPSNEHSFKVCFQLVVS